MEELDLHCETCDTLLFTATIPADVDLQTDGFTTRGIYCSPCYADHLAQMAADPDDPDDDLDFNMFDEEY